MVASRCRPGEVPAGDRRTAAESSARAGIRRDALGRAESLRKRRRSISVPHRRACAKPKGQPHRLQIEARPSDSSAIADDRGTHAIAQSRRTHASVRSTARVSGARRRRRVLSRSHRPRLGPDVQPASWTIVSRRSSASERTPSLRIRLDRLSSTARGVISSRLAISLFGRPSLISSRTSRSLSVSRRNFARTDLAGGEPAAATRRRP